MHCNVSWIVQCSSMHGIMLVCEVEKREVHLSLVVVFDGVLINPHSTVPCCQIRKFSSMIVNIYFFLGFHFHHCHTLHIIRPTVLHG